MINELKAEIRELVSDIYKLSDNENVVTISDNSFKIEYVGRGTDTLQLWIGSNFTEHFQENYMQDTLVKLAKIKKDLIGENE